MGSNKRSYLKEKKKEVLPLFLPNIGKNKYTHKQYGRDHNTTHRKDEIDKFGYKF